MKGHNRSDMDDTIDRYIRQSIKNWAAQNQPRPNGRARLLLVAASPASQQTSPDSSTNDLLQEYFNPNKPQSDSELDSYNINWGWAMHMSFAQLRHVA
jgi:hypothetical protein